jgi:hypothetical protein
MIVQSSIAPHQGQRRILQELLSEPKRNNTINAPRQSGKSVLGRELINFFAFNFRDYERRILKPPYPTKNCKIIWTSPTIRQAKKVFSELEQAWSPILKHSDKTNMILITNNNTKVMFFGVERPDNIRSENCNYMICDEFAFYKEGVFDTVLRPMLLVEGKMVFFISTPKGFNKFYELAQMGLSNDYPRYKYCKMTYEENPFADKDEIEDARKTLPLDYFKQEYLGEFVGGGTTVFGDYNRLCILDNWTEPEPTMEYYNGNDIAKQKDWTVSTTLDKNHKMVNQLRVRQINWQEIINNIVDDLKRYKPYSIIEVNGVGDPIYDLIRNKYDQIQPFITNNQTKQLIISSLITSCNLGTIKLPTKELCPSLHEQLSVFTFSYSKEKRQIMYHAMEGFHDDDVISLALANYQYRRFNGLE